MVSLQLLTTSVQVDTALVVLRVVFGLFLAVHGINKVRSGIDGTTGWFAGIGMKWPGLQARLAAGTEIAAGCAFAVGLLTPLAAAAMVAVMVVATWVAHRKGGFFIYNNGWEYTVSIAVLGIAIGTSGPGRLSLDRALGLELNGWLGAAIVLTLGLGGGIAQLLAFYRPAPSTDSTNT
jgi:putative oxidoreductase